MKNTHQPHSRRGGFTLLEVAIATVIIAVGLVALMSTLRAGTSANAAGNKLTTAMFLAQNIHEWTTRLPFTDPDPENADNPPGPDGVSPQEHVDDVDDLMNVTFCPPRDGIGEVIEDLSDWSQVIKMTWRNHKKLWEEVPNGTSDVIHVDVHILHRGTHVFTLRYFVFNMNPDTDVAGGG